MSQQLTVTLSNGVSMPLLGLGVYDIYGREAEQSITWALEVGYRLIDTAAMYGNEREVGRAIRRSNIARSEIFITTKVNNPDQGYDATLRAFEESLAKINCDYIDLYLIHWPLKKSRRETWRALERIYQEGRAKAIGVSNYLTPFLSELESYARVVPAVDQVELSPYLNPRDLTAYCASRQIQLQAYSPLARGKRISDPRLIAVADKHNKTPAQVMLRWILQQGISAIPKSASLHRLRENFDVFDFKLDKDDLTRLDALDEGLRVAPDPISLL